jgi:chitin synthase
MSSESDGLLKMNAISPTLYSDVSCGTKGDNKVSTDLGVIKTNKGENAVEVAVPRTEKDINAAYEDAIHVLSTKPPKEKKVASATAQEDFYRNFRTKYTATFLSFG